MPIFRVKKELERVYSKNTPDHEPTIWRYHADVIAPSEKDALTAANEGRQLPWRRIRSYDGGSSKSFEDHMVYGEIPPAEAKRPAAPTGKKGKHFFLSDDPRPEDAHPLHFNEIADGSYMSCQEVKNVLSETFGEVSFGPGMRGGYKPIICAQINGGKALIIHRGNEVMALNGVDGFIVTPRVRKQAAYFEFGETETEALMNLFTRIVYFQQDIYRNADKKILRFDTAQKDFIEVVPDFKNRKFIPAVSP